MTAADRPSVTDNARALFDELWTEDRDFDRDEARKVFVTGYEAGAEAAGRAETTIADEAPTAGTAVSATDIPVGTPVRYWPGVRHGPGTLSRIRSEVWNLCGTPVAAVEGYPGGIALTHIEVVPEQAELCHVCGDPKEEHHDPCYG